MVGFEDLNQKILIVVAFTGLFLLAGWYIKNQISNTAEMVGNGKLKHIESRRLAHASIISVFEINKKTFLILQDKQGSSVLDISEAGQKGRNDDFVA